MAGRLVERRPSVLKIREALRDLKSKWVWNHEFMRRYGISQASIVRWGYMFEDYRLRYEQTYLWSGSKQTIKRLEKIIEKEIDSGI